ncbi:MAG: hypothetical protein SFX73_26960 [Kofleriaceae bacterium]|nr:hypothetical protein [Kofleriaceae bacterium]
MTSGEHALVAWAGIRRPKTDAALVRGTARTPIVLPANTGDGPAVVRVELVFHRGIPFHLRPSGYSRTQAPQ